MNKQYRILEVRAVDGGARLLVKLELQDGEEVERESLSLLCARLSRFPKVGAVSEETVEELRREAAICAAIEAGLRALGAVGASRRHLTEKLRMRGYSHEVAATAVEILAEKGYLKEEEGALREVEKGIAKLWGDRRILADLQAKGYAAGAIKYAAARLHGEDGAARCAQLMRKRRIDIPADEAAARKAVASLMRYGYTVQEIKAALKIAKNR